MTDLSARQSPTRRFLLCPLQFKHLVILQHLRPVHARASLDFLHG
jgi:hypothetical protein